MQELRDLRAAVIISCNTCRTAIAQMEREATAQNIWYDDAVALFERIGRAKGVLNYYLNLGDKITDRLADLLLSQEEVSLVSVTESQLDALAELSDPYNV